MGVLVFEGEGSKNPGLIYILLPGMNGTELDVDVVRSEQLLVFCDIRLRSSDGFKQGAIRGDELLRGAGLCAKRKRCCGGEDDECDGAKTGS